jgi:hypothetical protein
MADLTRVKDPIEIAAASPDPVIRAIALKFKGMKAELESLEGFFGFYATQVAGPAMSMAKPLGAAIRQATASIPPKLTVPSETEPPVKRERKIVKELVDILSAGPLTLADMTAEYHRRHPDDLKTSEAIRVAAFSAKEKIGREPDNDKRYYVIPGSDAGPGTPLA